MEINFRQVKGETGATDDSLIEYFDGALWWLVVKDGNFWDLYQQWLSAGNTPLPIN
jgi:hypothetical protein